VTVSKNGESRTVTDHDLNRLAAFVEQRLDDAERRTVIAHLADCAECRAVVAGLTREMPAAASPAAEPVRWTRPALWLPIAASLTLVVGAAWLARDRVASPVTPLPATNPDNPPPAPPVISPPPIQKPPPTPPPDVPRGAGTRDVGGRTFRLEAGTWIDAAYDRFALLPVVDVTTPAERDTLLARVPALKPFLALGPKVTVVHEKTVYRFDLPR
jgi:hypothetical protein